ncbi:MAG: type II/IV secretion system protein [Hyphomonadaceae bacterium]|nr:type II/IV secretion system protein [Hyphomonadaceae bacterium]
MLDFGSLLVERGLVSPRDLDEGKRAQSEIGCSLGLALVRLGSLAETDLVAIMAEMWGLPVLASADMPNLATVVEALQRTHSTVEWLKAREAVIWFAPPIQTPGGPSGALNGASDAPERLHVAARNPMDASLQEAAEQWHPEPAQFYLATQQTLETVLVGLDAERAAEEEAIADSQDSRRLREMAEEAPVIDFVNAMFAEAITRRASDIHVEPFEDRFIVRMRVDGILDQWRMAPRSQFDAVDSRIKLLSGMDIAERRLPQDGRQSIRIAGREMDLRVSTLPTTWGESLVLRLLGKTSALPELRQLGVAEDHQLLLDQLIAHPNGVILVTGPTGSGKTTTIYRLLSQLNDGVRKILTVEDPVEFALPGVMQVQVKSEIGLTFAAGLRSMLRQDPDVIMIGEIRDSETARIAVQAALTGHLVISTVHTNSALAAAPRLLDLGVEEYLLADVLRGVVGQRLVRRVCDTCGRRVVGEPELEARAAAVPGAPRNTEPLWREAVGCAACGSTGFRGRVGLYEVMPVGGELQAAIRQRRPELELTRVAESQGYRTMFGDGLLKARAGHTTVDEVRRVVGG